MAAATESKNKRDQESHEAELRQTRVQTNMDIAYCLRNCLQLGETEEGEEWKAGQQPQWSEQEVKMLKQKLYNTLMGL